MVPEAASIAVIGIHGHGASHVLNAGRVGRLAAVVDPRPPEPGSPAAAPGVAWYSGLNSLLADGPSLDAVVLCTPLHTHAELTATLLRTGIDVLLEKPPTTTMAEFKELLAVAEETGRLCQVGFQSLGSQALDRVRELVDAGAIGTVTHFGARRHLGPPADVLAACRLGRHADAERAAGRRRGDHQPARPCDRDGAPAGRRPAGRGRGRDRPGALPGQRDRGRRHLLAARRDPDRGRRGRRLHPVRRDRAPAVGHGLRGHRPNPAGLHAGPGALDPRRRDGQHRASPPRPAGQPDRCPARRCPAAQPAGRQRRVHAGDGGCPARARPATAAPRVRPLGGLGPRRAPDHPGHRCRPAAGHRRWCLLSAADPPWLAAAAR